MEEINHFGLLSLIIALAAYVGAVRLAAFNSLRKKKEEGNSKIIKRFIVLLIPADFAFIASGILTFLRIFGEEMGLTLNFSCLDSWIIYTFLLGIIVLIAHHIFAWFRSIKEICKSD